MPLKEMLRAQLDSVRSDLVETYPHLTDDLLPWAPAEGMRTVPPRACAPSKASL